MACPPRGRGLAGYFTAGGAFLPPRPLLVRTRVTPALPAPACPARPDAGSGSCRGRKSPAPLCSRSRPRKPLPPRAPWRCSSRCGPTWASCSRASTGEAAAAARGGAGGGRAAWLGRRAGRGGGSRAQPLPPCAPGTTRRTWPRWSATWRRRPRRTPTTWRPTWPCSSCERRLPCHTLLLGAAGGHHANPPPILTRAPSSSGTSSIQHSSRPPSPLRSCSRR